jgi:RNA methyltransferase, TrmH family
MITSTHNPKVKEAIALRDRRDRDERGLFLIEGYRELRQAVKHGVSILKFFYCPPCFLGGSEEELIAEVRDRGAELFLCDERVFYKLSYRDRPDGLLGIALQRRLSLSDIDVAPEGGLFLIAEGIEKPGNLGTMLRSADAAGANGVMICDRCTDIYNPNVVRASVGTLFALPVIDISSQELLVWLEKRGIRVVAATPHASLEYTQIDWSGSIAIAMGTEQLGLSPLWMEAAAIKVRIPMRGTADSLNVASAATLLLYEAMRQRNLERY